MRKFLLPVIALCLLIALPLMAASKRKTPCAPDIASCAPEGCAPGEFDKNLNLRKNLREADTASVPVQVWSLADIQDIHNPENFVEGTKDEGGDRSELQSLGEGKKLMVVAYLIAAKAEPGGESCNCDLQDPDSTDNHLVLVKQETLIANPLNGTTKAELKAVFDNREPESTTAEFTPRIRQFDNHPNFTKAVMDPLINKTPQRALLVRVTGMLMFDSQHFVTQGGPVRVSNWELHPVLKMEFCTTGTGCKVDNDAGWKSVDDCPQDGCASFLTTTKKKKAHG